MACDSLWLLLLLYTHVYFPNSEWVIIHTFTFTCQSGPLQEFKQHIDDFNPHIIDVVASHSLVSLHHMFSGGLIKGLSGVGRRPALRQTVTLLFGNLRSYSEQVSAQHQKELTWFICPASLDRWMETRLFYWGHERNNCPLLDLYVFTPHTHFAFMFHQSQIFFFYVAP